MQPEPDRDDLPEIEITFTPRHAVLAELGISEADFEEALIEALEEHESTVNELEEDDEGVPELGEITLEIGGAFYRLKDLSEIEIRDETKP